MRSDAGGEMGEEVSYDDGFFQTALLAPLAQLGQQVLAVLPNVLAMLIIVGVGLLAARALGHLVERLLRVVRLDQLCDRLEINAALLRGGVKADPSYLIGRFVYWGLSHSQ